MLAWLLLSLPATPVPAQPEEPAELVRGLIASTCGEPLPAVVASARAGEPETLARGGQVFGERQLWVLAGGATLTRDRIAPGEVLRRVSVEYGEPAGDGVRPLLMAVAGADCAVRGGRRLLWRDDGSAEAVQALDASLRPVGPSEPLDAPVPAGEDPGGVIVAMVDAGVNYQLPSIAGRLAREPSGEAMGYDFWDMDTRPFDAHPAGSPFFVQRHGTRTASLMLAEAPVARLLPYRYPRPDMRRMRALVEHADARGVRIVNLSLGGPDREQWRAFEAAAGERPHMLFIVSAGNDGRDIDAEPVWPAALELPNLVVVTSANDDGTLAMGSNRGARSVDLMLPSEQQVATGFDGHARLVSGSSYAAARLSALAACLLAEHPDWAAAELRSALFALAGEPGAGAPVAVGLLLDPVFHRRGACAAEPVAPSMSAAAVQIVEGGLAAPRLLMNISLLRVEGSGRERDEVREALARANDLLGQCGVRIERAYYRELTAPRRLRHFSSRWSPELMPLTPPTRPAVFLVDDTLQRVAFEAQAIGRRNADRSRELVDTVWITRFAEDPGLVLAHELVHLLADSGAHADDPANLMYADTRRSQGLLTGAQCERISERGLATGLLRTAGDGQ